MTLFAPILAASPAALCNTPAFTAGVVAHTADGSPRRQTTWVRNRPAVTHAVRVDPFDFGPRIEPAGVSKDDVSLKTRGIASEFRKRVFPRNESGRDLLRYSTAHRGGAYFVSHTQPADDLDDVVSPAENRVTNAETASTEDRPGITLTTGGNRTAVISGRTRSALDRCSAFAVGFHPAVASLNRDSNTDLVRAARSGSARVQMSFSPTATSPHARLSGSAVFSYGETDRPQAGSSRAEVITGGRVGAFAREQLFAGSDFITADDLAISTAGTPVGVFVG